MKLSNQLSDKIAKGCLVLGKLKRQEKPTHKHKAIFSSSTEIINSNRQPWMENHFGLDSRETKLSLGRGSQAKTYRGSSGQRLAAAELGPLDGLDRLRPSGRGTAHGWSTPLGGSSHFRRRGLQQIVRKPKTRFWHDRLKWRGPTFIKKIKFILARTTK